LVGTIGKYFLEMETTMETIKPFENKRKETEDRGKKKKII